MGLKKLLVEWGFEKRTVRVEVEGPTKFMKVGGKVVVTSSVVDGELHCEWAEGWKVWEDVHQNEAFIELFKKTEKLLRGRIKGRGKAKIKVLRDISDRALFHPLGLERINPHQFRKIVALMEIKMKVGFN